MEYEQRIPRRGFLRNGVIAGAGLSAFGCSVSATPVVLSTQTKIKNRFGFHDTPTGGGSRNVLQALEDGDRLKINSITGINLSEPLLIGAQDRGWTVTNRIFQLHNRFNPKSVEEEVKRVYACTKDSMNIIWQPFNEVNRLLEVGDPMSPEEHVNRHFLPATELISQMARARHRRARIVTTPLARNAPKMAGFDEEAYFKEFLSLLKPHIPTLDCEFILGLHPYILQPGEDPLEYLRKRSDQAGEILGKDLQISANEAGLHQSAEINYSDDVIVRETRRIFNTDIPDELLKRLEEYDLWIYANYAQRPEADRSGQGKEVDAFELPALRRLDGISPNFRSIEEMVAGRSWFARVFF